MESKEGDCGARVQERQKSSSRKEAGQTFMGGWESSVLTQREQSISFQLCLAL